MAKSKQFKVNRANLREKKYVEITETMYEREECGNIKEPRRNLLLVPGGSRTNHVQNSNDDDNSSSSSGDDDTSYLLVRSRKCKRKKDRPPPPPPYNQDVRSSFHSDGSSTTSSIGNMSGGFFAALSSHGHRGHKTTNKGKDSGRRSGGGQSHNGLVSLSPMYMVASGIPYIEDNPRRRSHSNHSISSGSGSNDDDGVARISTPPIVPRLTDPMTAFAQVLLIGSLSVTDVTGTLNFGDGGLEILPSTSPKIDADQRNNNNNNNDDLTNENDLLQGDKGRNKVMFAGNNLVPASSSLSSSVNSNEYILRALYQALFKPPLSIKTTRVSRPINTPSSSPRPGPRPSPSPSPKPSPITSPVPSPRPVGEMMAPSLSMTSQRPRSVSIDDRFVVTQYHPRFSTHL